MAKWKDFRPQMSPLLICVWLWTAGGIVAGQRVDVSPSRLEVVEGQDVTFSCQLSGAEGYSVSWRLDQPDSHLRTESDTINPSLKTAKLVITAARRGDTGEYKCVATSEESGEMVTMASGNLAVLYLDKKFRSAPESLQLIVGNTATFKCDPPLGNPPAKVSWRKDKTSLDPRALGAKFSLASDNSLTVRDVQPADSAWYTCVARNRVGHRRATVRLTVYDVPKFLVSPSDQQVTIGQNFTLPCRSEAMAMSLFWRKSGGDLPTGRFQLVNGSNLAIFNAEQSDAGDYVCTVNSPAGDISATANVEVVEAKTEAPVAVSQDDLEGSGMAADPVEPGAKVKRPLPPLDEGSGEEQLITPTSTADREESSGESPTLL